MTKNSIPGATPAPRGHAPRDVDPVAALCRELRLLAKHEDDQAAAEAANAAYWLPCPTSVLTHRAVARALLSDALRLEAADRASTARA